jgi:hypothetical protein
VLKKLLQKLQAKEKKKRRSKLLIGHVTPPHHDLSDKALMRTWLVADLVCYGETALWIFDLTELD